MHSQPQMPQPRPAPAPVPAQRTVIPPPPPPPPSVPDHPRPADLSYPTAKKARIDEVGPTTTTTTTTTTIPVPPIPPSMAMVPPTAPSPVPPTVALPAAVPVPMPMPATTATDQVVENDTEVLQNLSESDFANSLSDRNIPLSIIIPNDPSYASWGFNGQTISMSVDVMTKVKALKQQLQVQLQLGGNGDESMPVNKMQLKSPTAGFLKDSLSLAYLNIGPNNALLELVPKVRGGKRK